MQRFRSFQSIHAKIDADELDILELFAQRESITTTEVTDFIKSTKIEMTQKMYITRSSTSNCLLASEDFNAYINEYNGLC